ncbi:MAG: hypothetical protein GX591_15010 [Planctomycetes bacterium]|nr:hypothetical protein [Planctomycetota bacterium]
MTPPKTAPEIDELRRAVSAYLEAAYGGHPPAPLLERFLPPAGASVEAWLMGEQVERDPSGVPFEQVRSFALRLGNSGYPHMKLRLTRTDGNTRYVFSVDAHDMVLHAPPGSPDAAALDALKKENARIARCIVECWHAQQVRTEHDRLREMIRQAKDGRL